MNTTNLWQDNDITIDYEACTVIYTDSSVSSIVYWKGDTVNVTVIIIILTIKNAE